MFRELMTFQKRKFDQRFDDNTAVTKENVKLLIDFLYDEIGFSEARGPDLREPLFNYCMEILPDIKKLKALIPVIGAYIEGFDICTEQYSEEIISVNQHISKQKQLIEEQHKTIQEIELKLDKLGKNNNSKT
jgi:hypothetical protein